MLTVRTIGLSVLLALLAAAPPAVARTAAGDAVEACAPLIAACAGYGPSAEASCIAPLLEGRQDNLPKASQADVAACNSARASVEISPPPAANLDGARAAGGGPEPVLAWPAGQPKTPNIVFILTDDFAMNLMTQDKGILPQTMPNLARMIHDGASFSRYFVTDSLCCPSRTTIFTGLLPHNSGVFTNTQPDGGYWAFDANGNTGRTFAVDLHAAGYATAMMGKYLNGYNAQADGIPAGWSEWDVASNGYQNYNYLLNENGVLRLPGPHLTDEMSILGRQFIAAHADRPFFLELASFSPHSPFVPPVRYEDAFRGIGYPATPAYAARPGATAPAWLAAMPPLSAVDTTVLDEIFLRRLQSDRGVDDMIGAIRDQLDALGIADRTYLVFSSDNGFHLGEYSLRQGKQTPFDTDINVPLVVVGPRIGAGTTVTQLASNLDLAPTFAEIAGIAPRPDDDGKSLLPLMTGSQSGPWRGNVVIEHHQQDRDRPDPDKPERNSGDPPSYEALRTAGALYVEYATGEVSYYDLAADPWELTNTAPMLGKDRLAGLHAALKADAECRGPGACWAAQAAVP